MNRAAGRGGARFDLIQHAGEILQRIVEMRDLPLLAILQALGHVSG